MKSLFGAAALAFTLAAAPAYATTTFAQYEQIDNTDTVSFTGPGALTSTTTAVVAFNFVDPMPPSLDGPIDALLIFSASGAPYSGVLQFLRQSDGANLLTVDFAGAVLSGMGTSGSFLDAQPGGTVTFSSDFLDFSTLTASDFALSFSALSSPFGSDSWTANSTGTFAAQLGAIPEPATWAMMIIGFGGVGAVARQRRRLTSTLRT